MAKAPKKILRVGIVGCGGISKTHATGFEKCPEADFVACCDLSEENVKKRSEEWKVTGYSSLKEMAEKEKLDLVSICTPHPSHKTIAIEALGLGLHVFSEKPLAVSINDADEMIKAATKAKKRLGGRFQYRFHPLIMEAKKLIEDGEIGELLYANWPVVQFRSQAYFDQADWRGTWRAEGGGALINQTIHDLDILVNLLGMPKKIFAKCRTHLHDIAVEDYCSAILSYENGATVQVLCSICGYVKDEAYTYTIAGTKGLMEINRKAGTISLLRHEKLIDEFLKTTPEIWGKMKGTEPEIFTVSEEDSKEAASDDIGAFVKSVARNKKPLMDGKEARKALELCNGFILSSELGKEIKVPVSRSKFAKAFEGLLEREAKGDKPVLKQ